MFTSSMTPMSSPPDSPTNAANLLLGSPMKKTLLVESADEPTMGTPAEFPSLGPEPLWLTRCEVDELYDVLQALKTILQDLALEYILIKSSLLGAIRSESIPLEARGIEVAVLQHGENVAMKLQLNLPGALARHCASLDQRKLYTYEQGRIRSSACPRIGIDVLVLNFFERKQDLLRATSLSSSIPESAFPLYCNDHARVSEFSNPLYFSEKELWPLRTVPFGPILVTCPSDCLAPIERESGKDWFMFYVSHEDAGQSSQSSKAFRLPLSEEHYLPVQHSQREKRVWSNHSRKSLEQAIDLYKEYQVVTEEPTIVSFPSKKGMARTQSVFAFNTAPTNLEEATSQIKLKPQPKASNWFGKDVRQHIGDCPDTPVFDYELRSIMEPHLAKARKRREEFRNPIHLSVDASIASSMGVPYTALRDERRFLYDEHTHPMHQILAETLGVDDLSQLHLHPTKDKQELLSPLQTREGRQRFQECYDNFVTSFCIPLLHALAMTRKQFHRASSMGASEISYRYQAFPCLRVVRPGEFSIGPHCDAAYGHSIGNLNFHIPLTPVFGTNALFTESHPGREDWHGLTTKSPGLGFLFDGARCLHFTLENTTDITRVSIDFRIAIYHEDNRGRVGEEEHLCPKELLEDRFSASGPGYYDEASVAIGVGDAVRGALVAKKRGRFQLLDPDHRVGFPFTK